MNHPLYPVAQRLIGRPVSIYHINGTTYRGCLHSVHSTGIYVAECNPAYASSGLDLSSPTASKNDELTLIYSPLAYFGFGALAGLTFGSLAARRPYYW